MGMPMALSHVALAAWLFVRGLPSAARRPVTEQEMRA
jgi:hypothetical protein